MVASLADMVATLALMARYQRVLNGHGHGRDVGAYGCVHGAHGCVLNRSCLRPVAHGCVHGRVVGPLALMVSSMARMVALLALMVASLVGHGCVLGGYGRDLGAHGAVSTCPWRTWSRRWR